jgi:hypothetical protein
LSVPWERISKKKIDPVSVCPSGFIVTIDVHVTFAPRFVRGGAAQNEKSCSPHLLGKPHGRRHKPGAQGQHKVAQAVQQKNAPGKIPG